MTRRNGSSRGATRAWTGALRTWLAAAFISASVATCVFSPESTPGVCVDDKSCDDGNDCTDDVCAADGYCDHVPSSALPDDENDCTVDSCNGTEPVHTARADGEACGASLKLHCSGGKCTCAADAECGDDTKCIDYSCVEGACTWKNTPSHTRVNELQDNDCKVEVCDGKGAKVVEGDPDDAPPDMAPNDCKKPGCDADGDIIDVPDDGDLPVDDGNDCTAEVCSGGVGDHPQMADDSVCGQPGCEDKGGTYEATVPGKCQQGACVKPSPTSCGYYNCKDDGSGCRDECDWGGHCTAKGWCDVFDSKQCKPRLANGSECLGVNEACESGKCRDGVCCNEDCNGLCRSCRGGDTGQQSGTCANVKNDTDPGGECWGICGGGGSGCCNGNGGCK